MKLYQILVPVYDNEGVPFPSELKTKYVSDVIDLVGGASFPEADGIDGLWKNDEGKVFRDKLLSMQVAVESSQQLNAVMRLTRTTFNQQAVMAYKVSDEVIFEDGTGA